MFILIDREIKAMMIIVKRLNVPNELAMTVHLVMTNKSCEY